MLVKCSAWLENVLLPSQVSTLRVYDISRDCKGNARVKKSQASMFHACCFYSVNTCCFVDNIDCSSRVNVRLTMNHPVYLALAALYYEVTIAIGCSCNKLQIPLQADDSGKGTLSTYT